MSGANWVLPLPCIAVGCVAWQLLHSCHACLWNSCHAQVLLPKHAQVLHNARSVYFKHLLTSALYSGPMLFLWTATM